jgi:hypothetical protein
MKTFNHVVSYYKNNTLAKTIYLNLGEITNKQKYFDLLVKKLKEQDAVFITLEGRIIMNCVRDFDFSVQYLEEIK